MKYGNIFAAEKKDFLLMVLLNKNGKSTAGLQQENLISTVWV